MSTQAKQPPSFDDRSQSPEPEEVVLYMLHCGLDGRLLQEVCRHQGVKVRIHQFPREELFSYHMHTMRKAPDLILIRGHFISLVEQLDKNRHIPYAVVSSKLKYGDGQPVFVHAEKGYDPKDVMHLYRAVAQTIKGMVESRRTQRMESPGPEGTRVSSQRASGGSEIP